MHLPEVRAYYAYGNDVERQQRHDAERTKYERHLLTEILQTYAGRAFVWSVRTRGLVGEMSAVEDPYLSYFNEGCQAVGQWAEDEVFTIDPQIYIMMRNEAADRERRYNALVHNEGIEEE